MASVITSYSIHYTKLYEKPFVYGLALEDRGKAAVFERIGVEPTGDAFNEVSLESSTGRPRNPMINAGAIVATSP